MNGIHSLMMATIAETKGEVQMDKVVSHVKRIDAQTGITHIMTIGEMIERVGEHIPGVTRNTMTKYGKMKVGSDFYHVIDSEQTMVEILGRSVMFDLRDGQRHLVKVTGIGFMGTITGVDIEGMNITFTLDKVDSYYLNSRGPDTSSIPEWAKSQGGQV